MSRLSSYRSNHAPAAANVITADDESFDEALSSTALPGVSSGILGDLGILEDLGIVEDLGTLLDLGVFEDLGTGTLVDLSFLAPWRASIEKMVKRRARIWKSFMVYNLR